jgi:formylglycine-generating enzyme required for sulfatase activity
MLGNVWEWCADWSADYPPGAAIDPAGPSAGDGRIVRGGSLSCDAWGCRAAFRARYPPSTRLLDVGLRLCVPELPGGKP